MIQPIGSKPYAAPLTADITAIGTGIPNSNTAMSREATKPRIAVDRFGIVSERAVLLDALTVIQNLAMPFTLEIEPPPAAVRERAEMLAREVGLPAASWERPVAELGAAGWLGVRFGRAIALDPTIVLLEHASARLDRQDVNAVGAMFGGVAAARGIAMIAVSADEAFAKAVADRVLTLEPATGRLKPQRRWFGRLGSS